MEEVKNTERKISFPLIGKPAPEFTANTTNGPINFPSDYKGKWVVFFSHPGDFTPVCTTEFMAFANMYDEFKALDTELVGLSVSSVNSHLAWIDSMKKLSWGDIKNPEVKFPIIDDVKMEVADKYGMVQGESDCSAVRAVFIVDPNGIIRSIIYYPAPLARNMQEIKRAVIGLQKVDKEQVALPADWKPGDDVIVFPPATADAMNAAPDDAKENGYEMLDWYLTFKKDK